MKGKARKTKDQIKEEVEKEYKTLRRLRGRKYLNYYQTIIALKDFLEYR